MLGIESSCDDTGVALLRASDGAVLGEAVVGQAEVHAQWGGVVPTLAKEAHKRAIDAAVEDVLCQAGLPAERLGACAATVGPGLSMCLQVCHARSRPHRLCTAVVSSLITMGRQGDALDRNTLCSRHDLVT